MEWQTDMCLTYGVAWADLYTAPMTYPPLRLPAL